MMKKERKIFNFESKILDEYTLEKEGYYPNQFGPASSKYVWATCRFCGEPSRLQKGSFRKSGSACHRSCLLEELKILSPFKDKEIHKKAQQKINELYGNDRAEINKKISESRLSIESQEKYKKSMLEKYGVENSFQSEEIKDKIKETMLEKYGVDHVSKIKRKPNTNFDKKSERSKKIAETCLKRYGVSNAMKVKDIRNKAKETCLVRYGVDNPLKNKDIKNKQKNTMLKKYEVETPLQNKEILDKMYESNIQKYGVKNPSQVLEFINKSMNSKTKTIIENKDGYFDTINAVRNNTELWQDLKTMTLRQVAEKYNIHSGSLRDVLNKEEFIQKYQETYSYPKKQAQKAVFDLIKEWTGLECIMDSRKIIPPYELDIYLPEKKFAIEFNGSYFHSEARKFEAGDEAKESHRNYHLTKTKICEENGIRLFHIFEHDWIHRQKQISGFLKSILDTESVKIFARKCIIDNRDSRAFIEDNHYQGNLNIVHKFFNLIYNDEIVASMTASPHHRHTDSKICVLSRLCFKIEHVVIGGASRLFEALKEWARNEGYAKIISWSNNCWTQGNIYKILGFQLEAELLPDYFYYDKNNNCYHSKQSQRKFTSSRPKELTRHEWCAKHNLYRIWDCGKKRWAYYL